MDYSYLIQQILTYLASLGLLTNNFNGYCPEGYLGANCEIECGVNYFPQNVKIVGGSEAIPYSWPAQIYLKFSYENYRYFEDLDSTIYVIKSVTCGGTLIDRTTVLTAASCIPTKFSKLVNGKTYSLDIQLNDKYPTYESMLTVYLGLNKLSDINLNDPTVVKMNVRQIIKHEKYNQVNNLNDIAILKLAQPVDLNQNIQVACLPKNKPLTYPSFYQSSYAIGWGEIFDGGSISNSLKNTKLSIYDSILCENVSPNINKNWTTQICAGDMNGNTGICNGDIGGPLYVTDIVAGKEKYVLAGIASYSDGCARFNKPGVYTRISTYLDWINRNSYV